MVSANRQIDELQSLRGLASLVVVVSHCLTYFAAPRWFDHAQELNNAVGAVVIFYVLSGFVLARSIGSKPLTGRAFKLFYAKRLFRIYPALWVSSILMLLYLATLHGLAPAGDFSAATEHHLDPDRRSLLHVMSAFAGTTFLLPQAWSVAVELVASVLLPIFVFLYVRHPRAFWIVAVAITLAAVLAPKTPYYVVRYLPCFIVGLLIAFRPFSPSRPAVLLSWVGLFTTQLLNPGNVHHQIAVAAQTLFAVVIICSIVEGRGPALLKRPSLIWLGDISYSLYLIHWVVLCASAALLNATGLFALGWPWSMMLLTVVATLCSIAAAAVSYRYVELPGIRFGLRAIEHFQPRRQAAT